MRIKNLLLADDDIDDAELFAEALSEVNAGVHFSHVENGMELIKFIENHKNPDLIFLDLNMPRMNGWQTLNALKNNKNLKNIPVVVYTTSSQAAEQQTAIDLGAEGLLIKPSNYDVLKKNLDEIFANTNNLKKILLELWSKNS